MTMPIDTALRELLTDRINLLLGPPASESQSMRRWICGVFELGLDLVDEPGIWIETRWYWDNVLLIGVDVDFAFMGQSRPADLDDGFTFLGSNPLYRLRPRMDNLDAVMTFIEYCRERSLQA